MRIVFLGSPAFALPTLEALLATRHEVVAVVSQPDRPAGRGHRPTPPPIKVAAQARGLPVLQPADVSDSESVERLLALAPDVIVVCAYGQILRQRLLDVPKRGLLNVHASLLPRFRGAAPVAAAILAGEAVTGVTIMEVVRALDAGPIVAQVEEPITPFDTTGSLEARLARAGARLLAYVLDDWYTGRVQPRLQDDSLVTYAPQIRREEARLDWSLPAVDLWRRVRAFNPWPGAYTLWQGQRLKIHHAHAVAAPSPEPGQTCLHAGLPAIATSQGLLVLDEVQPAGKKSMTGKIFLQGARKWGSE